jgi:hypothetical protein
MQQRRGRVARGAQQVLARPDLQARRDAHRGRARQGARQGAAGLRARGRCGATPVYRAA